MATLAELTEKQLADLVGKEVAAALAHARGTAPAAPNVIEQMQALFAGEAAKTAKPQGSIVGGLVRSLAAGKGNVERAAKYAGDQFGADSAVSKALAAGVAADGGFLVRDEVASEVIELLRANTVIREAGATVLPMNTATFTLPKLTGGATATWVGENENIGVTQPSFGQIRMTFRKLAAVVPVSNDLIRYGSPGADAIVRNDLVMGMARTSDLAFIRGQGTEHSPRGLRSFALEAGNTDNANGTVNLANVTSDLGKALLRLLNGNIAMTRPAWLMAPRSMVYLMTVRDGNGNFAYRPEMSGGTLWGYPFYVTTQIPINLGGNGDESEILLADMGDAIIGEGMSIQLDASGDAAYHDGSAVQAAYSKDQTVVRAIMEVDFIMRHAESVTILQQVKWAPA